MEHLNRRQIRLLLYYDWSRHASAAEAARNITDIFGQDAVSERSACDWFNRFRNGKKDLEDEEKEGRPIELDDDALRAAVKEEPEATTRNLEKKLGFSHTTIERHLQQLGYRKVMSRWIPHALTDAQKGTRLTICQSLLSRPNRNEFLQDIVTGDESWVLYHNDTHHAVWLPPGENPPSQPKPDYHQRKILLCCFWDTQGLLYYDLIQQGNTVSAPIYIDQLDALAQSVREKRRRRAKVILLHDNARPHVAKVTQKKLASLGIEVHCIHRTIE